ncbi:hypothetical protein [Vibrio parahaemolyticus]|uniref:hypothetical protein n=1 Tax=Vibrio parahaemolyticus TaxID=670 RepID=UPI0023589B0F|nr:hypothetical protein [Vibrio parahaemolyticus]
MTTRSVANVPYIVALPGWASTTLMHGLTEGIETVLAVPTTANTAPPAWCLVQTFIP